MTAMATRPLQPPEPERPGPTSQRLRKLLRVTNVETALGVVIATVVLITVCALFVPHFTRPDNLLNVAQQIAILTIVAAGMTLVIISGEIDLSVGSQYGVLAVFLAWVSTETALPLPMLIPLTVLSGVLIGAVNGVAVTVLKIPSFVATPAMLGILRGAALLLAEGVPLRGPTDNWFRTVTAGQVFGNLVAQTVWMLVVVALVWFVMSTTKFGSDVYSVGGNAKAARDAGIPVVRIKIACFAVTGGLCGVAAVVLVGWLGSASPLTGQGFELSVIAAVVVGGVALAGGVGSVLGTLLGAVITGVIANALVLVGVDGNWQQVATGVLIFTAVLLNRFVSGRHSSS